MSRVWRRRLLIVAALYFTFIGGTFLTDHRFWPRVAHHAIVTLVLLGWAFARLRSRAPRALPATALDAPLLAYFLANLLATALAVDPRISAEFLWRLGVHILLYYVLAGLFARGRSRDLLEALFFSSGVVILLGVVEFASWYFGLPLLPTFRQGWPEIGGLANPIPPRIYRLNFTLGFSTGLSAYLAALIPFGLAFAITGRAADTRRGFWLWLAGALLVEGLSFSRGGLLSMAVSLPVFVGLALLGSERRRARIRRLAGDRRVWALAGLAVAMLGVFGFGWSRQLLDGHRAGDAVRLDLWRSALDIFAENPVTGVGPYGFGRALRAVRDPLITGDRHLTADNRALTTLAESGLIGTLALAWLAAAFVRAGVRRWRNAEGPDQLRVAGAFAGVVGFGIHNLVDTFTATPILLPMLVMAAFVCHRPVRETVPQSGQARLGASILLVLIAVSGVGWAFSDAAQFRFERSLRLAGQGDFPAALAESRRAEALDPALGLYAFQSADILGRLAAQDDAYLDDAIAAYENVLAREGSYDLHLANQSALYAQTGQVEAASAEMQSAGEVQPRSPHYAFWQGVYAESSGEEDAASDAYAAALSRSPAWAASGFWSQTGWREGFLVERLGEAVTEENVALLLAGGETDAALAIAREVAARSPADARAQRQLGEAALRAGELDEALSALDRALTLDPTMPPAYSLRAETRLATGDLHGAEHDARVAIFLDPFGAGRRGEFVLAQIAAAADDFATAEAAYQRAGPVLVVSQGWDVSVYGRTANFQFLPQLEAPGPGPVALEPWLALKELYVEQGRPTDAIDTAIRAHDPYFTD